MDHSSIKPDHWKKHTREFLASMYPDRNPLRHGHILKTINSRGLALWKEHIAPKLGREQLTQFELALDDIQIRAGRSIPWSMASGFTFSITCHDQVGGKAEDRDTVGVVGGLCMVIVSVFDRLIDEYPERLGNTGQQIKNSLLDKWLTGEDLEIDWDDDRDILSTGLLNLFRLFFSLCRQLESKGNNKSNKFSEAVKLGIKSVLENDQLEIRGNPPSAKLIESCELPSIGAYLTLGLIAALPLNEYAVDKIEPFARDYARLTWMVDDIVDIDLDTKRGLWNGLAVRLALAEQNGASDNKIYDDFSAEIQQIMGRLTRACNGFKWETDDDFSLADIMWTHIWTWLGGEYEIPLSSRHPNPAIPLQNA